MRFLLDAMLGKLARDLRALGYDAAYEKDAKDDALVRIAREEDRLLVTRDVDLAKKAGEQGLLVRHRDPTVQLDRLMDRLNLTPDADRFLSRCMECNTPLQKANTPEALPTDLADAPHWSCPDCDNVYWIGSHAKDMLDRLSPYLEETPRIFEDAT